MNKIFFALLILLLSASAGAQVFPYSETFDSYTVNQPLNGNGGIHSSTHVYVTPHGVVGNCGEFQMTDTATVSSDTLISPLIGPLTAHSVTSFYFRAVTYSGGVASVYHMTAADLGVIYVGGVGGTGTLYIAQDSINTASQNTDTNYVKVVVPIPSLLSGYTGKFKIIAYNPSGNNWKLEFDSLVVRDTVPVPPVLRDSVTNVTCRGLSTGGIKVIPTVATPPYTYLWSPGGDTTQAISGVPAGVYTVTVTDHLGVTASLTDTIGQPAFALILDSLLNTPALCYGSNTGTARIVASGGTTPYSYLWSNTPPSQTATATDLSTGNYNVTVSDANGCSVTASTHISQPANALITTTSSTQSSLDNNGTATVTATGGTGTIHYAWSTNPVQTTAIASGLAPGLYEVTVSDGSGCVIVDTVFVAFPTGINEISAGGISIYPNPAKEVLNFQIGGSNTGQQIQTINRVTLVNTIGQSWDFDNIMNSSINIGVLAAGLYMVKFTTATHYYYIGKVVIEK
jgi:hypothetical protein